MQTLALILIVLVASTLQAATGFGFAIMSIPFFLLLFEPHMAIQLNIVLSLILCLVMIYRVRNEIDRGLLFRLTKGSIIGLFPGLMLFIFFDAQALSIFVGIIILLSAILLIAKVNLRQSNTKEIIAGVFSGLLTASIGMGGPPLMIYFLGSKTDKNTLHGTTIAYFVLVSLFSFILQLVTFDISNRVWTATLWSIPFLLLGILLGQWIFTRLNQQLFRNAIYILLVVSGIYMLLTNLPIV